MADFAEWRKEQHALKSISTGNKEAESELFAWQSQFVTYYKSLEAQIRCMSENQNITQAKE